MYNYLTLTRIAGGFLFRSAHISVGKYSLDLNRLKPIIKNPPGSQEDFRTKNSCFPSLGLSRSGIKGQQQFPPANIKIFNYFSATSFIPDAAFAALRTYYPDPDCKNTAFCQTTELLCLLDGSLSSSQTCDRHTIR